MKANQNVVEYYRGVFFLSIFAAGRYPKITEKTYIEGIEFQNFPSIHVTSDAIFVRNIMEICNGSKMSEAAFIIIVLIMTWWMFIQNDQWHANEPTLEI